MARNRFTLGDWQRRGLHASFAVLLLTGVAWWGLHRWGQVETEFGPQPHPLNPRLMRVHGAAAMIALVVLGTLLSGHVRNAWRARRNRASGAGMVAFCGVLTVTGYALYYAGSEGFRAAASLAHLGFGLALPVVLIVHIRRGRQARAVSEAAPSGKNARG
jgi:hypothetical protein